MLGGRKNRLSDYKARRDFRRSPEPSGGRKHGKGSRFVIQQHAASSMHWDFRLEIEGVLVSWAVPKGPSTDPREKRLAVRTEDHPTDYGEFEGIIPEGEYGAGAVIVWDTGRYRNLRAGDGDDACPMADSLDQGQIEVFLEGEKLTGGYALVHARVGSDEKNWLLVKMDDEQADARRRPTSTEPESVLSGRTVEEVADDKQAD